MTHDAYSQVFRIFHMIRRTAAKPRRAACRANFPSLPQLSLGIPAAMRTTLTASPSPALDSPCAPGGGRQGLNQSVGRSGLIFGNCMGLRRQQSKLGNMVPSSSWQLHLPPVSFLLESHQGWSKPNGLVKELGQEPNPSARIPGHPISAAPVRRLCQCGGRPFLGRPRPWLGTARKAGKEGAGMGKAGGGRMDRKISGSHEQWLIAQSNAVAGREWVLRYRDCLLSPWLCHGGSDIGQQCLT